MDINIKLEIDKEFYSIMQELSVFHNVFLSLWKTGKPLFTDEINTAAVYLDENGECLRFVFNQDFWNSIDRYTKAFVICHECLHVILNHGYRSKQFDHEIANYALDVAVNHMLVNNFGFIREKINDWEKYCWVDTVFKDKCVSDDKNFEYYYNLIKSSPTNYKKLYQVDYHDKLPELDASSSVNKTIAGSLGGSVDNEGNMSSEKDFIPGVGGDENLTEGNKSKVFQKEKSNPSAFWDRILKDIEKKVITKSTSQFVFKNRRLNSLSTSFLLPNDYETDVKQVSKPDIYLFLDCSGSCYHLCDKFFKLAGTIDENKYNVKLFSRTTTVKEIVKDSLGQYQVPKMGGSDNFSCIENYIQMALKNKTINKYPIVIHFTDGGDCARKIVNPEKPEQWYWLLSKNGMLSKIPSSCKNIYYINEI